MKNRSVPIFVHFCAFYVSPFYVSPFYAFYVTGHEFISGLGQTVNLSVTYGKSYSSGALIFRGGDSTDLQRGELIDQLPERGLSI